MTTTIDETTIVSPDTLAAGGRAIAESFGLGDSTMPSNDWPVDDGDTVLSVELSGAATGRLLLAVNDEVGGRMNTDHGRVRTGFRTALDAMLAAAGLDADIELGEITPSEERPRLSVEIYDGKQMCALFGAIIEAAAGDDGSDRAVDADAGMGASGAAAGAPVFEPASLMGAGGATGALASGPLSLLHEVEMDVTVELGRTSMPIRELLSLQPGMVIEIDRQAGTPIDVLVNGRLIACGEVVVIDEEFGIRITEIVDAGSRL